MVDWPAQSPDLNLIENLWSIMENRVSKRIIWNSTDLWAAIEEEWNAISPNMISSLYRSMPSRISAVLRNKGHHCKY